MNKIIRDPKYLIDALILSQLRESEIEQCFKVARGESDLLCDFPELYDKLFELYSSEMPYGTQKARDGDPTVWLTDRLSLLFPESEEL